MVKQSEQPLYPKLSSIYNKILQLLSAILLMVLLMTFWLSSADKSAQVLTRHFEQMADNFLQQAVVGVAVLLKENNVATNKPIQHAQLQLYVNKLAEANFIKQVHLYDETGLLLLKSGSASDASATIKLLYGIDKKLLTEDKSKLYRPFISEIRQEKLLGYMRLTIEKSYLTSALTEDNANQQALERLLLIIAGLIGFLLTRGLYRGNRKSISLAEVDLSAKE